MKLLGLGLLNLFMISFRSNMSWVLAGIILSSALWAYLPVGIYLGGDWTLPATGYQSQQFFNPYVWNSAYNFGMPSLLSALGLPYGFLIHLITALGLPNEYLGKAVLTLVIVLGYFSLYSLLRYFKLRKSASIIGALIYISTPTFFNYSLMGWQFALLAMALFPLAAQLFCQAVRQDDTRYAIGVSLIWAIATLQSQSMVWYPILFFALGVFLIRSRRTAQVFIKKLGVIFIIFVGLSCYWWIAVILFQDAEVTSNAIVISAPSVGADGLFNASNALRLWGGLYNFQYETTFLKGWVLGSWILPVLATVAILASRGRNRKIALAMALIAFVLPAAILILKDHREILMAIPGAALIRQLSRFTVLTSFAYAVLVGIFLDSLLSSKRLPLKLLIYPTVAMLIILAWPWWSGAQKNNSDLISDAPDFRFRVKEFPNDYYEVEKYLNKIKWISRALYLPYGMSSSYKDDPKYSGAFKEAVDIFGLYSPIPGIFMPSDRASPISDFITFLDQTDNLVAATQFTSTNFYVLRKNLDHGVLEPIFFDEARYFPKTLFDRIWRSQNITIYARKTPTPLIYSPTVRQLHGGSLDALYEMALSELATQGMAMVFTAQNSAKKDSLVRFSADFKDAEAVEYRKISPTKYRIRLHRARGDTPLIFGESYSHGWKLYPIANSHKARENVPIEYAVAAGNERYQADTVEALGYSTQGWISETGGRFISKQYFGAIQNDNLPDGSLIELWNSDPLPEERHIKVNGYANGWIIDVAQICSKPNACHQNDDGSYELELVMEFWPQKVFYLGLSITLLSIFICGLLWNRERRNFAKTALKNSDLRN